MSAASVLSSFLMRRTCVIVCALAAVALLFPLPASAAHHPPNSETGYVTLTVQKGDTADSLVFSYVVTQHACSGLCYENYGKPYNIAIYIDAPGGAADGVIGLPTLVNGPPHCVSATRPAIYCDSDQRNTDDASTILPMSGSFTFKGVWVSGATAEIVVEGFSLNSYQEGVSVPARACSDEQEVYDKARAAFEARAGEWADDFVALLGKDGYTLPAGHDAAKAHFQKTMRDVKSLLGESAERYHDLHKCLGDDHIVSRALFVQASACTDDEWTNVLAQTKRLKLIKAVPLVKKIKAAKKARRRTKAASLHKQLNSLLAKERKSIVTLQKKVETCL